MKSIVVVTIVAPSSNDLKQAEENMIKAIDATRLHINNGAKIKRSITNADDPSAMMGLFGQLKWWSLGKRTGGTKQPEKKKQGWLGQALSEIGKAAKSVYEDEIEI